MTENKNPMPGLVLTAEQIQELAKFAEETGRSILTICHGRIGLFDEDGAEISTGYKGLIAHSSDKSYIQLGPMQSEDTQVLKVILTAEQVKDLASFAKEDGQPKYCITHSTIPAFVAEGDLEKPEYSGLIAYSESEKHGVLQLEDTRDEESFESVVKPVIEWLGRNQHPHRKVLVTSTGAELLEALSGHRAHGDVSEIVQTASIGSAVNIGELSVSLSLDDSKIKEQLKDPELQRLLSLSTLKEHTSQALGKSPKDNLTASFKFPLGLVVKTNEGETGHVRRIVMSDNGCNDYLVNCGQGAEKWFGENELSYGRDLRTGTIEVS